MKGSTARDGGMDGSQASKGAKHCQARDVTKLASRDRRQAS